MHNSLIEQFQRNHLWDNPGTTACPAYNLDTATLRQRNETSLDSLNDKTSSSAGGSSNLVLPPRIPSRGSPDVLHPQSQLLRTNFNTTIDESVPMWKSPDTDRRSIQETAATTKPRRRRSSPNKTTLHIPSSPYPSSSSLADRLPGIAAEMSNALFLQGGSYSSSSTAASGRTRRMPTIPQHTSAQQQQQQQQAPSHVPHPLPPTHISKPTIYHQRHSSDSMLIRPERRRSSSESESLIIPFSVFQAAEESEKRKQQHVQLHVQQQQQTTQEQSEYQYPDDLDDGTDEKLSVVDNKP
jgi:hypothetical protein